MEEAVGNTSVLDVTPPEAGTVNVPFVYWSRKASGVDEY
jgi:hypothetical protein